jgi:hypothetical protein
VLIQVRSTPSGEQFVALPWKVPSPPQSGELPTLPPKSLKNYDYFNIQLWVRNE